jgi:hypothetical protein
VNNACIPDGGDISLTLSGSEANVRYELWLDGNPLVDSIVGTGNALSLLNASQSGIYTVRASYSGMACFIDMPQQVILKRIPKVSLAPPSVAICAGQNTSIQLNAEEEVFVNYSVLGGATQRVNISTGALTIPVQNASVGSSISISSVESVSTGCINNTVTALPIPVSATPTIALSQSKIPCVGETVELEYSLTEALSFTYNLTGTPVQNTLTSLTGAIKLQNMVNNANISLTNIKSLQSGCQNNTPLTFAIKVDEKPIISPVYNLPRIQAICRKYLLIPWS